MACANGTVGPCLRAQLGPYAETTSLLQQQLDVRADSVVAAVAQSVLEDFSQNTKSCIVQVHSLPTLRKDRKWSVDLVQIVRHLASFPFFGFHFTSVETVQGFHRATYARAAYV